MIVGQLVKSAQKVAFRQERTAKQASPPPQRKPLPTPRESFPLMDAEMDIDQKVQLMIGEDSSYVQECFDDSEYVSPGTHRAEMQEGQQLWRPSSFAFSKQTDFRGSIVVSTPDTKTLQSAYRRSMAQHAIKNSPREVYNGRNGMQGNAGESNSRREPLYCLNCNTCTFFDTPRCEKCAGHITIFNRLSSQDQRKVVVLGLPLPMGTRSIRGGLEPARSVAEALSNEASASAPRVDGVGSGEILDESGEHILRRPRPLRLH